MHVVQETWWTDWFFGLTLPAGDWLSLWGSLIGAFSAVILAIYFERMIAKRRAQRVRKRLKNILIDLERALAPYEHNSVDDTVGSVHDPKIIATWTKIVAVDALLKWAIAHPDLISFDSWAEIAHLGASFEQQNQAISEARMFIPSENKILYASKTHGFAKHILPQARATIAVL